MTEYYTLQLQNQIISQIAGMFMWLAIMAVGVGIMVAVASYVMESVGLYVIARRRCLKNPWMAWVPVLKEWLLGSVSDQYRYVVKGQIRNKRRFLLILAVIAVVIGWVGGLMIPENVRVLVEVASAQYPGYDTGVLITGAVISSLGIGLITLIVRLALKVLRYMALYDLYASCDKKNDVLYLVLSILFGFLTPVLLFLNRNKDEGMPPRRQAPVVEPEEFAQV